MKVAELRQNDEAQLKSQLGDLKKELFNLRFQKASGELENTSRFKQVRKDIARIKTVLTEQKKTAKAS